MSDWYPLKGLQFHDIKVDGYPLRIISTEASRNKKPPEIFSCKICGMTMRKSDMFGFKYKDCPLCEGLIKIG